MMMQKNGIFCAIESPDVDINNIFFVMTKIMYWKNEMTRKTVTVISSHSAMALDEAENFLQLPSNRNFIVMHKGRQIN